MPTGYTHKVQTGEVTEFPEFAMQCARAFSALIMMRDAPPDAEIPDEFAPSGYYEKALADARERLEGLRAMPFAEVERLCAESNTERADALTKFRERKATDEADYRAMLAKAEAWTPPTTEHLGLQDFMVKQLSESIDFDCGGTWEPDATPETPDEWLAREIVAATNAIERHTDEHRLDVERTEGRTAWVRALRESLATPAATEG